MTAIVHKGMPHEGATLHVTGSARYIDDIQTPEDTAVAVPGISPVAAGKITKIDLDAVSSHDGIIAVLTADDIPGQNDVSPIFGDDPMLADGHVYYSGQIIYVVVAESVRAARAAMRKAVIEISPTEPILTIEQAMSDNHFLEKPRVLSKGDPKSKIKDAPHKIDGEFTIGGQEHFYLEGMAALAIPEENHQLIVHVSSQHPTEVQHKIAKVLGWSYHDIQVEVRRMGGGFGGKESQSNQPSCIAALGAVLTGRPVKLVYDRDDDMKITGKRHDVRISYQAGFDDTGRITGVIFDQALRCGMSYDLSYSVAERAILHADSAYHVPHMKVTSYLCKTNTPSNTAFRGFGSPQGMLGMERVIDHIAHHLGRDPLDIRKVNFYPDHDASQHGETHYGQVVTDGIINDLVARLEASSKYSARRAEIEDWNKTSGYLKRGIALTPVKFGISFNLTLLNQAGALVHVYTDGSVALNHGGTEMGQGLFTKVKQITAEVFGISVNRVRTSPTHTGKVPNTSATAASSGTDLNGMAAFEAATAIRDRMAGHLAALHQTEAKNVMFADDKVKVGDHTLTFAEAADMCWQGRVSLSSTGFYSTPDIGWDPEKGYGKPFYYYAYGAAVTEVIVDLMTGEHRLLRADILHDAGKSINPDIDLGQIEGAYIQGVGWLTIEEVVYGDDGKLLTHAPSTYKIPATADRPLHLQIDLYDSPGNMADTIFKSKAVGEPPLMLAMSAFFALSDALASGRDDYPFLDAPASAERLALVANRK